MGWAKAQREREALMMETQKGDCVVNSLSRSKKRREERMGEKREELDLDAKWDACVDLSLRRFLYSSLAGAFGGLLFFRSPTTRWASVAFGAGVGIGSAYTECSYLFAGSPTKFTPPNVSHTPPIQNVQDSE